MRTANRYRIHGLSDGLQYVTAFENRVMIIDIPVQLFVIFWNSRGVHHQLRVFIKQLGIIRIMHLHPFAYQLFGKVSFRSVIATYFSALLTEKTCKCAHAYAAYAY